MVWALQRCNNSLDDAIHMLEKIPDLEDDLVKMQQRVYVMGFPWKQASLPPSSSAPLPCGCTGPSKHMHFP